MEISKLYQLFTECKYAFFTDSRKPLQGALFFALKGANFNANQFAQQVLAEGAAYAIVDETIASDDPRLIRVSNVEICLQQLAHYHRKQCTTTIIGITGTNGKTTTKELLYAVLQQQYKIIATMGNLNNHLGVPMTLLRLKPEHQYAIIEMGANHVGEIAALCEIADPDIGIITSIGKAHLEGFGSVENILTAKTELFKYLQKKSGIIFCNMADKQLARVQSLYDKSIPYGFDHVYPYSATVSQHTPTIRMEVFGQNQITINIQSALFGMYNASNIMAACVVGLYLKVSPQLISEAILNYLPTNMRSQWVDWNSNQILLDAYNANPSSMQLAIESFAHGDTKHKWLIIGRMAELGNYADEEHRKLVELISKFSWEQVLLIGEEYAFVENPNWKLFKNASECKTWLDAHCPSQKTILIKGSRSNALEQLLVKD